MCRLAVGRRSEPVHRIAGRNRCPLPRRRSDRWRWPCCRRLRADPAHAVACCGPYVRRPAVARRLLPVRSCAVDHCLAGLGPCAGSDRSEVRRSSANPPERECRRAGCPRAVRSLGVPAVRDGSGGRVVNRDSHRAPDPHVRHRGGHRVLHPRARDRVPDRHGGRRGRGHGHDPGRRRRCGSDRGRSRDRLASLAAFALPWREVPRSGPVWSQTTTSKAVPPLLLEPLPLPPAVRLLRSARLRERASE